MTYFIACTLLEFCVLKLPIIALTFINGFFFFHCGIFRDNNYFNVLFLFNKLRSSITNLSNSLLIIGTVINLKKNWIYSLNIHILIKIEKNTTAKLTRHKNRTEPRCDHLFSVKCLSFFFCCISNSFFLLSSLLLLHWLDTSCGNENIWKHDE